MADVAENEADLQVMYAIDGKRELRESILEHLSGYEGARPVRIGNDAYRQRQHDTWGALLDSVYLHVRSREHLPERVWPTLVRQVESALAAWREPDRGIWEVRGEPKHFTSSKVFCWLAADRGARLASMRDEADLAAHWHEAAREIHDDVCANGTDARGVFVQHYDTTALDASLLLLPLIRFLPPTDPRIRATVLAIADELTEGGLVLRYHVDETDDGLPGEEGTFTICSFWLVSALVEIGELERARKLCEKLLAMGSSAAALRRGDRSGDGQAPRELPAGVHAPGADQRRHARRPRRAPRHAPAVELRVATADAVRSMTAPRSAPSRPATSVVVVSDRARRR